MGYPAGITPAIADYARQLAGVAETRAETPEQRSDNAKDLRAGTRDRRVAVDYYLGHSHTRDLAGINQDDLDIARASVLQTLARNELLSPMPPRVIERLLIAEERATGQVVYINRITHREQTLEIGVPFALTGTGK